MLPTAQIPRDWFDWTSLGVGSVGLFITLWAVWAATGAKQAAIEARKAVRHRNAADSFAEVVRLAEQFATWVECERRPEAAVQVREIVLRIARDRGEFGRFLSIDADTLGRVESSCRRLADFLGHEEFPDSTEAKREMLKESLWIVQELSAVLGRARARMEDERK
jgi:hypothetical protein